MRRIFMMNKQVYNWVNIITVDSTLKITNSRSYDFYLTIGENSFRSNGGYQFMGTVYMEDCYVKINDVEVWRGFDGTNFNYKYKSKGTEDLTNGTITFTEVDSYIQPNITLEQLSLADSWEICLKLKWLNKYNYQTPICVDYSPHNSSFDGHVYGITYQQDAFRLYLGQGGSSYNIVGGTITNIVNPKINKPFYLLNKFTGSQYSLDFKYI